MTPGLLSKYQFLSLYLPAIMLALGQSMIAPVIPTFAKTFDVGLSEASLVFVVGQAGTLFVTLPAGYLMDKVGRRPMLIAGPLLTAVSSFMTPLSATFWQLLLWRAVNGAANQLWMQARLAMIADTAAHDQRARQINWMQGMSRAGTLFGPALGGFLAVEMGTNIPFWIHAVLTLLTVIPTVMLIKETAPELQQRTAGQEEPAVDGSWKSMLAMLLTAQIAVVMAIQFGVNWARGGNEYGALNLYAVYAYGVDARTLGLMNTASIVVGLPVPFITGWLMDRFGRKAVIVPSFIAYGTSLLIMSISSGMPGGFLVFLLSYGLVQFTQGTTMGTGQIMAADAVPPYGRGRYFAIWRLIGSAGSAATPGVFGLIAEHVSYGLAFLELAISAFAVALLGGLRVRKRA